VPRAVVSTSPGIELEYETFGDAQDQAVLLIAGWGQQLITWHHDLCAALASRGFHVVRFDNRDIGLSTKVDDGSQYTLEDMAADAAGLLDVLGIERAHVMGVSMGGMIAQSLAIHRRERVLTLTSIMSTTGDPAVGGVAPAVTELLARPLPQTGAERVAFAVETARVLWGDTPQFPFDEEHARWRAEVSEARCFHPLGRVRQLLAIHASGDRTAALRGLRGLPALVIHGDNDPLIDVSGGKATAAAVPGAELMVVEGMGHVVPRHFWPRLLDAFERLATPVPVASSLER
jgi:pimeloyl-ACP methyl ester carboxylesterase